MSYEGIQSGAIIRYPYLWSREAAQGESAGRKQRSAAVAVRSPRKGKPDFVLLFPITSRQPGRERFAAEIPEIEKHRGGLDPAMRLWIILDECNEEQIPGSFYLEPDPPIGRFSKRFFLPLLLEIIKRRESVSAVRRRE